MRIKLGHVLALVAALLLINASPSASPTSSADEYSAQQAPAKTPKRAATAELPKRTLSETLEALRARPTTPGQSGGASNCDAIGMDCLAYTLLCFGCDDGGDLGKGMECLVACAKMNAYCDAYDKCTGDSLKFRQ